MRVKPLRGKGPSPTRRDGFIELPWYATLKHFATKANNKKGYDLVLTGPASSGKTTAAYMLAHDLKYDIVVQQCHRRVEVEEFKGTRSIVPGKGGMPITGFDPGSLTRAVLECRTKKGVVYLIDEIALVDPAMLAILNNLTQRDKHSCLSVPELGKEFQRPDNLIIIGTMNPEYAGNHSLSEAFLSRVVLLECPMMSRQHVRSIMLLHYPKPVHVNMATRLMFYIESGRINQIHQWEPDLRTMLQFLDLWIALEPGFSNGRPLDNMLAAFEQVIAPKIGWIDSYASVREAIKKAIRASLGSGIPADDDDDVTFVAPMDDE